MPWKESNVLNLRTEFIMRAMQEEVPFTALCSEYGISPKTGYKWKERFLSQGLNGLSDQSRKPHSSPTQISEDQACRVIRFKLAHRSWGPKKIRELLIRNSGTEVLSLSTVKRILDKSGLVEHRRHRRSQQCGRIENRLAVNAPNDLWTVDFKGWWYSCDKARIEPLTVRDAHSRFLLCVEALPDSKTQTVRSRFERIFETYGLPQAIRSDNGSPFASYSAPLGLSRLSAWWVALGICLDRIEPGHPEQNGGHERMHRDIACELEGVVDGDMAAHQGALEIWKHGFNYERPHEALGMRVPADVYVKSQRKFDPAEFELLYPAQYLRRKVTKSGSIKFMNRTIYISFALACWDVGLKPLCDGRFELWFGMLCLGEVDVETESFTPVQN